MCRAGAGRITGRWSTGFGTARGRRFRDLLERYGPWRTAYERHRRWSVDGTWAVILHALQTGSDITDADREST
ncbi:transposase [Streptomyces sp. NPDC127068]|uniref:transposase n=1 Tax=Streptomyces sp. NPDC127068 TaxID=3347127 RepID=UPI0036530153